MHLAYDQTASDREREERSMKTDVEIAGEATPRPIVDVTRDLGLSEEDLHPYGRDVAKVDLDVLDRPRALKGEPRFVLVSAITPTPAGEGKTTTCISLADALSRIGESVCLALREPSLGPCMGINGGAAGGGYSQVIPMERINLHFTGKRSRHRRSSHPVASGARSKRSGSAPCHRGTGWTDSRSPSRSGF